MLTFVGILCIFSPVILMLIRHNDGFDDPDRLEEEFMFGLNIKDINILKAFFISGICLIVAGQLIP